LCRKVLLDFITMISCTIAGLHFLLDFTPVFNLGLVFRFVTENNI
jgi:hypothetical protein